MRTPVDIIDIMEQLHRYVPVLRDGHSHTWRRPSGRTNVRRQTCSGCRPNHLTSTRGTGASAARIPLSWPYAI